MNSAADALLILRRRHLLPLTTCGKLIGLTELIAGSPIKGSWWAHPSGKEIFRLSEELADTDGVTVVKLVRGKQTFIDDKSVLPPLLRVVRSGEFHRHLATTLTASARALLAAIEKKGRVRLDRLAPAKKTREAAKILESSLAVHATQEHTESGKHESVLRSWSDFPVEPSRGSVAESIEWLRRAAHGEALPAFGFSREK